jgi:glucose-1-phosphate thymidylyltransferase
MRQKRFAMTVSLLPGTARRENGGPVRKGIVLAGGSGTRLYPITRGVSKQLLPIYDKPMIYYPLSTLMLAGIRSILVITTPADRPQFERLLGDGAQWGLDIAFAEQPMPTGLGAAFTIGASFIGDDSVAMALGDNIFFGHGLPELLAGATRNLEGASIFVHQVSDPQRYGVVTLNLRGQPVSIEEKPANPQSNWAVTGLYFFDNDVVRYASELRPSSRGELEITDLLRRYMALDRLHVEIMGRGFAWFDTGTFGSLIGAAQFVQTLESRQGMKISCLEEIAFRQGFIDADQVRSLAVSLEKSGYGDYLFDLLDSSGQRRRAYSGG